MDSSRRILKIAKFIESKIDFLSRLMGIIGICVLVTMMLFTVLNVIMRRLFNRPIPGDVELIEVGMVCVTFWCLAWCAIKGRHVAVDLVVSFFPKRIQAMVDSFGLLLSLGISFFLARQGFVEGFAVRDLHILSDSLGFPIFPFYWVTALGYAALCLAILVLLARSLSMVIKK